MGPSRLLASVALGIAGFVLALYGLFALAFREGEGGTYVMLGGHRLDAGIAGGLSLVLGVAALVVAGGLLWRRPEPSR